MDFHIDKYNEYGDTNLYGVKATRDSFIFVSYLENKGLCMHIPFYMNDLTIVVTTHAMF